MLLQRKSLEGFLGFCQKYSMITLTSDLILIWRGVSVGEVYLEPC